MTPTPQPARPADPYGLWCEGRGVTHAHCPDGCPKPQPFVRGGVAYCGRCWFRFGELVPVVGCTPETCQEDA